MAAVRDVPAQRVPFVIVIVIYSTIPATILLNAILLCAVVRVNVRLLRVDAGHVRKGKPYMSTEA